MSGSRRCASLNSAGDPCGSITRISKEFCWFHEPGGEAERSRKETRQKIMEKVNSAKKREPFTIPDLETVADARALLGRLPGLVSRGELSHTEAGTLRNTATDFSKALKAEEADAQEERLEAMAAKIAELKAAMDA